MKPFPQGSLAGEILQRIEVEVPHFGLAPGQPPRTPWDEEIARLGDAELLGAPARDGDMARAVRSGLLLRADLLDASHALSQKIETTTGSYWHGIMHRREGDFDNAKYWFRRAGRHEVFSRLKTETREVPAAPRLAELHRRAEWDPFRFVDLASSRHTGPHDEMAKELERLQLAEVEMLLEYSYRSAVGKER